MKATFSPRPGACVARAASENRAMRSVGLLGRTAHEPGAKRRRGGGIRMNR